MIDFLGFQKIPRLCRECIVTEKIDGTNGQICIEDRGVGELVMFVGSRNRWITPDNDNHFFAKWAHENLTELLKLGVGRHYGEWWGMGINRGYGLREKRFSLFNTHRWSDDEVRPACCSVVPVIKTGIFSEVLVYTALEELRLDGSYAAPGFTKPEGVVIYHTAANLYFKKTLENDEGGKG